MIKKYLINEALVVLVPLLLIKFLLLNKLFLSISKSTILSKFVKESDKFLSELKRNCQLKPDC
ncbi:hypothetical protein HERIO_1907 [Hepatospora eriocheir]|uniref:Uncharacterized protein n=1 Tax=Hepatospora eriocheir TaxID=1081669 RepID=A0A1X0Q8M2_9MICR|nr:hypothetical protein HERIO_1907 [Hepatospora eriocheir]